MTITLNGTTGITNDATDLNYTGALTGGTGVVNLGSGQLVKDASGNVGIGTSSPLSRLTVSANGTVGGGEQFNITGANTDIRLRIGIDTSTNKGSIQALIANVGYQDLLLNPSGGNLLVGTTSNAVTGNYGSIIQGSQTAGGAGVFYAYNAASSGADNSPPMIVMKAMATTSSAARFMQFYANGAATPMGGIVGNGSSNVQFASISDAREKTNIAPISGSLDKVLSLKPVEFDWLGNGEHCPAGFVAQDVEQVFPEFVVENITNDGDEPRKGLTGGMTGGIVAHLVASIQEQQAIIVSLQDTLESLTARITALEAI